MPDLYRCDNKHCPLGSRKDPGYFTEGTSPELAETMGFERNGANVCPSCGEVGKKVGVHESIEGNDPYADIHAHIDEQVIRTDADGNTTGVIPPEATRAVLAVAVDVLENNAKINKPETAVKHAIEEVVG